MADRRLYTGCVDDGLLHKNAGLIRYLVISRMTDDAGEVPRHDLAIGVEIDGVNRRLYDCSIPAIAPGGKYVGRWHRGEMSWKAYIRKYSERLGDERAKIHLENLAYSITHNLEHGVGSIIQCVCSHDKLPHCHRILLAKRVTKIIREKFGETLDIEEFDIKSLRQES